MLRSRAVALVVSLLAGSFVFAHYRDEEPAALLAQGQDLLAARKPAEALAVLERVGGDLAKDEVAKEAAVLRVLALVRAQRADDAAKEGLKLLGVFAPDEPWRGRVEGLLADAATLKGDVKQAAEREQELAERALGDPEKARLAAVYVAWGERLGRGEPAPDAVRPGIPPNHQAAIAAYGRAIAALGDKGDTVRLRLAVARHALAVGDHGAALAAADAVLAPWKKARESAATSAPTAVTKEIAEAHLRRAQALAAAGVAAEARAAARALVELPSVDETGFAPDAWILLGRSFAGDPATGALTQALDAYATFLRRWPDHAEAGAVRRLAAEACLAVGAHDRALAAFDDLVAFPKASDAARAWARMRKAESLRALRRFDEARAAVVEFLAKHPAHQDVPAAQRMLPDLLLAKARGALEDKRREDALKAYAEFVDAYPLENAAPAVSLEIGHELRRAKETDRARDAYAAARERWRVARPQSAATAGLMVGVVEEEDRRDLEAAATAYKATAKDFAGQPDANAAAGRLGLLEAVELSLTSPRTFGPHEPAKVGLAVRNVKETTLRLYRLAAGEYFEGKGTLAGAEALDVALVKADRTWTYETPSFARYRADRLDVEIRLGDAPLPEGAYLVSAEADRRRATALLVVSKIRLVVKHAPTEVFAWAVDAKDGAPVAGVEVLVRGKGLKTSAQTGDDGTARIAVKPEHGVCEVLGVLGGSAVPGLAVAPAPKTDTGLLPRAHWTFDRPLYRPGDEVRWSVFLREVVDGAFATPEGRDVAFEWVDPRGRLVAATSAKSAAFGQAGGAFRLPQDGALGDWTLRAKLALPGGGTHDFARTVSVLAYRKPEFKVAVAPKKAIVRPGAPVEVKLSVESYFGGAPDRATYQWRAYRRPAVFDDARYREQARLYGAKEAERAARPDRTWQFVAEGAGATDEKGAAEFAFPSLELAEPQQYLIQATTFDATNAPTVGSGFAYASWTPGNVVVLPDRRAYRPGDRVVVKAIGVDWSGAPLALKGKAEIVAVRATERGTVEEPGASTPLDLGLNGENEAALTAPRAGRAVVRFTGEDAAGLKVVGEASFDVAGERTDLATEAKILFEREVYRAGEKARLFVDVPRAPAVGLLTFEAETVLVHRLVRVTEKSSVVEVELPELLAPNCVATWASVDGEKLLTSEDPVAVLRHLEISVTPSATVARPGEKVKLSVVAKDQAGKPKAAVVALAMTDAALDGLGGVGPEDPRFTFNRDLRPHLVRTGSSFAFRREAAAAPLDADLVELEKLVLRESAAQGFADRAKSLDALSVGFDKNATDAKDRGGMPALTPAAPAPSAKPGEGGAFGSRQGGAKRMRAAGARAQIGAAGGGSGGEPGKTKNDGPPIGDVAAEAEDWSEGAAQDAFAAAAGFPNGFFYNNDSNNDLRGRTENIFNNSLGGVFERGLGEILDTAGGATMSFAILNGDIRPNPFIPAPLEMREDLRDVAAWAPALVTGEDGRAEIEIELPDNLTVWTASAAALDRGTAGGFGAASVRARKDVFVRSALPAYALTGDVFLAAATGRHTGEAPRRMRLAIRSDDERTLAVEGAAEIERDVGPAGAVHTVRLIAKAAGLGVVKAEAAAAEAGDALKTPVSVLPFGAPWRLVERRALSDRATFALEFPADLVPGTKSAVVVVQAGLAAELLDGLAFLGGYTHATLDAVLNRVVVAAVVRQAAVAAGATSPVGEEDLRRALTALWTTLRSYQAPDGTFGTWPGGAPNAAATAAAVEALATLGAAGFPAAGDLAATATEGALVQLRAGGVDREARAALVCALARIGRDVSAELNALYREREALSTASLAKTLRAAVALGRGALKNDLLEALRARRVEGGALPFAADGRDARSGDDQETTAQALLAYQAAEARTDEQAALVAALRAQWNAHGCVRMGATAATALSLARHMAGAGALATDGDVVVAVDGKDLPAVKLNGASPRAVVALDVGALAPGKHEIAVRRTGGGDAQVRLAASAFLPAEKVDAEAGFFSVDRRAIPFVDPDRPEEAFAPGYSVVEESQRPKSEPPAPLLQAVAGTRVTVRVAFTARDDASDVVLEDPLPAGFEVVEAGVRGPFTRYERRADRMVFYFDRVAKGATVVATYPAYAVRPGRYRAPAAEAAELRAPEARGRSASYAFEIVEDPALLARAVPPAPTPDARFFEARAAFARGAFERVLELIGTLPTEFALVPDVHDEALVLVQRAALRVGRHAAAVKARDALLLRNPGKGGLPVDETALLGAAYLAVGDAERAREHFRAVIDDGFTADAAVAAFLDELGRTDDAALRRVAAYRRYPARGPVPEAELELADRYLKTPDPAVVKESTLPLQRMRWADALAGYRRAAAWYAGTALAERAGIERVRVFAGLGLPAKVVEEARAFRERNPEAVQTDEALASEAAAAFALGRRDEAKGPAELVGSKTFREVRGGPEVRRSPYAGAMAYLLGRIAHVEGRLDAAVALYGAAAPFVPEAAESYRFFVEKELSADAVVRVAAGGPAKLPVRTKNAAKLSVKLYPVDLGVLFATRKSFDALNRADLSGIAPLLRTEFETGAKPYVAATVEIPLATGKGTATAPAGLPTGAYLAVVSDGERVVTSVVLASDLVLTAQRGSDGSLRCYLVDAQGLPVPKARVTAAQNGAVWYAGETDERGMLIVALRGGGKVAVVAERGDRYAAAEL
jgi:uncharacterized protein YfaS (alpha-2-macroglobulin family)/TolA-binding protein